MTRPTFLILLPVIGGIAGTLQAHFMGVMDSKLGTVEGMFITYGGGGLLIGLAMLSLRGGALGEWQTVPWYVLSAGVLGLVVVGIIGFTAPRIGLVPVLTLFVASQFFVGAGLDHFGLLGAEVRPLDLSRASGLGVILFGVWLVLR
ncbi:MAG: DMT family transporter [Gemmatimonadota bacterium]|jgi:transporter family-2 protein